MNYLDELKDLAVLHARAQRMSRSHCREVLARIRHEAGTGPGSWAGAWSAEASRHEARGRHLDACAHYAMARFPYADGAGRADALRRCVGSFDLWRRSHGIERLEVTTPSGTVACWAAGLSRSDPRPVLLVTGGIVSVKEQWAPLAARARALRAAVVVTEMPGVGENTLPYTRESWRMFPALLDSLTGRADTGHAYALALSFSGHLAIRAALADDRVRGIMTVGAPITEFFTGRTPWPALPRTTTKTLEHLLGLPGDQARDHLRDWALSPAELAGLRVPLRYVACERDEIIPREERAVLDRHVPDVDIVSFDDVHGAPGHLPDTRVWILRSLLRMRGLTGPRTAAVGGLSALLRLRDAARRTP